MFEHFLAHLSVYVPAALVGIGAVVTLRLKYVDAYWRLVWLVAAIGVFVFCFFLLTHIATSISELQSVNKIIERSVEVTGVIKTHLEEDAELSRLFAIDQLRALSPELELADRLATASRNRILLLGELLLAYITIAIAFSVISFIFPNTAPQDKR